MPSWAAAVSSEALRRRVYLWAVLMGSVVLVVSWLMQLHARTPDPYVRYGHPVLFAQCLWVAWWLLGGRPLIVAERVVFALNALAILAQTLLAMVRPGPQVVGLTSSAYWMLVAISILSYLIFSNRQALLFSGSFFLLSVLLPWTALLLRGGSLTGYADMARVQLTCGAVLVLLWVLAWYRERFAVERGQRLSLEQLANTDPMTGVPNRRALYREVEALIGTVRAGGAGCLMLLDVDHFKRINDTFGHNTGDEVLTRLTTLIRADLRDRDTVGRWGGEEFLIVLPGVPLDVAARVAERLRLRLAAQPPGDGPTVTASFGVTACRPDDTLPSCTARADRALYAAKTAGRNRVVTLEGEVPEPDAPEFAPLPLAAAPHD